jgi:membrane protease subunit HflK
MADRYPGAGANGPEDPLESLRELWEDFRGRVSDRDPDRPTRIRAPGFNPLILVGILLLLWAASGIYIVAPDERGIILRFGRVVREAGPGPGYHLPYPIEEIYKPSVTQIRKEEFGFRTVSVGPPPRYVPESAEALMLTGDENIVKLQFIVQYKVKDEPGGATDFLFNVRSPRETLRAAAEAAMREVAGSNEIDDALTEGKARIQDDVHKRLQDILDQYDVGIQVAAVKLQDVDPPDEVSDAFKDVISAQQDKERLINEANGYANDVVPKARGQAAQLINEAEAYKAAKVRDAGGQAQRFIALEEEYAKAKDITRERLYLETMEIVLGRANKILLDDSAGNVVPYLPLDQVLRSPKAAPAGQGAR